MLVQVITIETCDFSALLYIKEGNDEAYHAIYLQLPTVEELLKAVSLLNSIYDMHKNICRLCYYLLLHNVSMCFIASCL